MSIETRNQMKSRQTIRIPSTLAAQRGVSLIEVLISVLILGIGMLGIAAMQAAALRNSQSSMQESQAVIEANAMLDAMRANPSGNYAMTMASPCTTPASGGNVTTSDKHWWIANLKTTMGPSACGSIEKDKPTAGLWRITVQWNTGVDTDAKTITAVSRLQ